MTISELKEYIYNENKELTGECVYKYDDNGNLVSEIRTDENGEKYFGYYGEFFRS